MFFPRLVWPSQAYWFISKANFRAFSTYLQGQGAYQGNSILKNRVLVNDRALFDDIVRAEDFQNYRRKYPDFGLPPETVLTSRTTPDGLQAYGHFVDRLNAIARQDGARHSRQTAAALTGLIFEY
ncbi:MAG: hypothetical protein HQ494_01545 [Rhodospirillales bacterium]|nr:hypothetical protein [Rhodospirillales bacterium]